MTCSELLDMSTRILLPSFTELRDSITPNTQQKNYRLDNLKEGSTYEVRLSYPAITPADFYMRILGNCKNEHGLRTYLLNISAKATGVSAAKDIEKETVTYNLVLPVLDVLNTERRENMQLILKQFELNTIFRFELGRQSANTKLGSKRIHLVRVRGGSYKRRALRLENGNFSWGSEGISRKTRILTVVYNASNNELVRTNTLVKGAVIQIDATPFRQWYESHYAIALGKKKAGAHAEEVEKSAESKSKAVQKKLAARAAAAAVDPLLDDQFNAGRLYAVIASRPGQSGRCDGYILEGKELEFYLRKIKSRK
ncbi:hypothetical protein G6F38_003732 [Rhizopus arrhizus]|nr:hypothetical protein G6F38_003732 [Rhizopus arrhizus]